MKLYLGDRTYSSWSLRAWIVAELSGLEIDYVFVDFSDDAGVAAQLGDLAPARTVPTLVTDDGAIVSDSLALAAELASRAPDAGLWPEDTKARAIARTLASEMHAGFSALRSECPMNLRLAYKDVPVSEAVLADLARLETVWTFALEATGGPWLGGTYSIADAFYAPVAARIATYGLPVNAQAQDYVDRHLAHPLFRAWRAHGLVEGPVLPWYAKDYATAPWPGPLEDKES